MKRTKTTPKKIGESQRGQRALELRLRGKTFDQIAKEVGFSSRASAYNAVNRILAERAAQCAEKADELRALEVERLDIMLHGLWEAAESGNVQAVDRVVKIQERRAKLLGLDAPAKQELSGPDGDPIKIDARGELVSRIASLVERARTRRDPVESE